MKKRDLGGNIVTEVDRLHCGLVALGDFQEFVFLRVNLEPHLPIRIDNLSSWSAALVDRGENKPVTLKTETGFLELEDYAFGENLSTEILSAGHATLIVAGSAHPTTEENRIRLANEKDVKRVNKPWGLEYWLNEGHPVFCFKKILIRAGHKTSLQYHRLKKEINFLHEGKIKLHYKSSDSPNDQVGAPDISQEVLEKSSSIQIKPDTLHRIEALTEATLYEISTPHLDDVVRVIDETNRTNGRIASEHEAA